MSIRSAVTCWTCQRAFSAVLALAASRKRASLGLRSVGAWMRIAATASLGAGRGSIIVEDHRSVGYCLESDDRERGPDRRGRCRAGHRREARRAPLGRAAPGLLRLRLQRARRAAAAAARAEQVPLRRAVDELRLR